MWVLTHPLTHSLTHSLTYLVSVVIFHFSFYSAPFSFALLSGANLIVTLSLGELVPATCGYSTTNTLFPKAKSRISIEKGRKS
jgi:hypothetical protein